MPKRRLPPTPAWQRPINQFFLPLAHVAAPVPPLAPVPLMQPVLLHQAPMLMVVEQFRRRFESAHTTWCYLGVVNNTIYYCDYNCCEYFAYSLQHGEIRVGNLEIENVDYFIVNIEVSRMCWRQGIGTNLVRFANQKVREQYGRDILVIIAPEYWRPGFPEGSYLTAEGKGLIMSCYNKGILKYDQLIGNTPDPSYNSDQWE